MGFYFCTLQLALVLISQISHTNGANILVIHAIYSGSPLLTWRTAGEYFASQGHQVHYLRWKDTHNPSPLNHPNLTETVLTINNENGSFKHLTVEKEAGFDIPFDLLLNEGLSSARIYYEVAKEAAMYYTICDQLLGNTELIAIFRRMSFQVAIVDLVGADCSLAFANHLDLPTIGFWGMQFASGEATLTTAFLPPSHAPNLLTQLGPEMTFLERVVNSAVYFGSQALVRGRCWFLGRVVEKHFPGSPELCSLYKELSGLLINSDHVMDSPQLLPPSFVRVGGMHIRSTRPLPKDLEEWMESSGDAGVVLFAAGYTISPKVLPIRFIQAFFTAASRLPQKFLMKLEGPLVGVPDNVKLMSWIPQQDVLAHARTKLFVNHCGLQGVTEALFHGVPMVGMPIFLDQGDYLVKLVAHGVALPLDRETASVEVIYQTLSAVLNNPDYKRNASRLSTLMRNSPDKLTPQQRALNLVEYVVLEKGAPHLKMKSRHLNILQYFCLDVFLFVGILMVLSWKFARFCYNGILNVAKNAVVGTWNCFSSEKVKVY